MDAALPAIWIYVFNNPSNLTAQEWWSYESKSHDTTYSVIKPVVFDEVKSLTVKNQEGYQEIQMVIKHNDKIYDGIRFGLKDIIFNQVLSTFRWIE